MVKQHYAVPADLDQLRREETSATVSSHEVLDEPHVRWWIRSAELATGFSSNAVLNFVFDWLLYPFVIFRFGLLWGGLTMSLASFAACIGLLRLYDLLKRDWLGIETIRGLRDGVPKGTIRRVIAGILRRGDIPAFLALSLYFDPFITVAYLRRKQFGGMARREWCIFIASWAVGNGSWMMACFLGVRGLQFLWGLL